MNVMRLHNSSTPTKMSITPPRGAPTIHPTDTPRLMTALPIVGMRVAEDGDEVKADRGGTEPGGDWTELEDLVLPVVPVVEYPAVAATLVLASATVLVLAVVSEPVLDVVVDPMLDLVVVLLQFANDVSAPRQLSAEGVVNVFLHT